MSKKHRVAEGLPRARFSETEPLGRAVRSWASSHSEAYVAIAKANSGAKRASAKRNRKITLPEVKS